MQMLACQCPRCGAPLDLTVGSIEPRCPYCHGSFQLAEVGASAKPNPSRKEGEFPQAIDAVAQLDREWRSYQRTLLDRKETGEYDIPDPEHCRAGMWVVAVIGLTAALVSNFVGERFLAGIFVVAAIVLILVLRRQAGIGRVYLRSLDNYRATRLQLLQAARPVTTGSVLHG